MKTPRQNYNEESKIINMFEKIEYENMQLVTRLLDDTSNQIITRMLESENKQESKVSQMVCALSPQDNISEHYGPSYFSHQFSKEIISKLK